VDGTNPLVDILRLSGVVSTASAGNRLQVRNRIYAHVFDRAWVQEHMPDAELRRQRAAYRRGVLRATVVYGVLLALIGTLALAALRNAHRAESETHRANREAAASRETAATLRRSLYAAEMYLARQAWEERNYRHAQELLEAYRPRRGDEEDLRDFAWRLLWSLGRDTSRHTFEGNVGRV
jgi:hypothetical protein